MVARLDGSANVKIIHLSVPAKLKSVQQMLSPRRLSTFCNLCQSTSESGHSLSDTDHPTVIYNNNNACVKWSHNMTPKAARHIELRENLVPEWVLNKILLVKHIAGKVNPEDIFTKEMCDGTHF
jgi:hypothetical protein